MDAGDDRRQQAGGGPEPGRLRGVYANGWTASPVSAGSSVEREGDREEGDGTVCY